MNTFGLVLLMIVTTSGSDMRIEFQTFETMRECETTQAWFLELESTKKLQSYATSTVDAKCFLQ